MKIDEGIINIDSEGAKQLGFTSDKFNPASWLWRTGNTITISFIVASKKGAFCQLMKAIAEQGFDFEIPTPSPRMLEIGKKQGWNFCQRDGEEGVVDILTNKKPDGGDVVNYKYLSFIEIVQGQKRIFYSEKNLKAKMKVFEVRNKLYNSLLGYVKWYVPWRRYCFFTDSSGLVFDASCLADIQDFINKLMAERKGKRKIDNTI
jgi:hypothetical protein